MIELTDEMERSMYEALAAAEPEHLRAAVRTGLAAVLATVERDFLTGCRATVETRGVTVFCKKEDDGHDTHLGRRSGWDVIW